MESTRDLVLRARGGDTAAREAIAIRYLPALLRIAHGRLPQGARGLLETRDLVQSTVIRALDHLGGFEARREGAFLSYLRTILLNQIRDEARRAARTPGHVPIGEDLAGSERGPLEQLIGRERIDQYEKALERLPAAQREAVILRLEFGCSFADVATAIGMRSANTARMAVDRAVRRIAEMLKERPPLAPRRPGSGLVPPPRRETR